MPFRRPLNRELGGALPASFGIAGGLELPGDGIGQLGRLFCRYQVGNRPGHFRDSADVGGDDGAAGSQRFDDGEGHAFGVRGLNVEVEGAEN